MDNAPLSAEEKQKNQPSHCRNERHYILEELLPIYHIILFLGRVICSSQKIFVILTKIRKSKKKKQKNHLSFTFNIKLKKKKNKTFFLSLFLSLRICFCFFIFLLPTKTNCLFCVVKNYWNAAYTHKWRNFCYQMCLWNDTCKKLDSILPSTHIITNTNIILLINISVWAYYWANWVWFVCSTTELYPKTIQWNLVKTPPFPHTRCIGKYLSFFSPSI